MAKTIKEIPFTNTANEQNRLFETYLEKASQLDIEALMLEIFFRNQKTYRGHMWTNQAGLFLFKIF